MNNKKSYQLILLDWDGCLADTLSIWLAAYQKFFFKYGLTVSDKDIVNFAFGTLGQGPKKMGIENGDEFFAKVQREVANNLSLVRIHNNVNSTLQKLFASGKKLAILTSSTRESITPVIKKLGWDKIISLTLGREDVTKSKPDPEIVNKALAFYSLPANSVIIVGDSEKDIITGKNSGIATVLYYPVENKIYYNQEKLLKLGPDYFIRDFTQLISIVK